MYKTSIRYRDQVRWTSTVAALALLECLAERDPEVVKFMTLDTVDDCIEAVIQLLEDARNQRYMLSPMEEK